MSFMRCGLMFDTGTDWAALADKLNARLSEWLDLAPYQTPMPVVPADDLRAAAVGLRRLAQLDTAIGDPGNLRLLADTFDLPILRRIADAAVLGSGERPEGTEPRRPLPPVNPGQRMPGGPTPQP